MIDTTSETLLSMIDACRSFPGRPHLVTIYCHVQKGVLGVRLELIRCGGRRYTSAEAIQRFDCWRLRRLSVVRSPHPSQRHDRPSARA